MNNALIEKYRDFAALQSEASKDGRPKVSNRAYDGLVETLDELVQANLDSELFSLFDDPDTGVQMWAAAHTLELDRLRAEEKLEELSAGSSIAAFEAEMTLNEWKAGHLRFRRQR
ncbi:hypothetical protein GCM10007928_51520 [Sulfitobacter porphyrae]|nr:hypothetical protein GCM10007928_51520 [Sulfitobacter porphyrae]